MTAASARQLSLAGLTGLLSPLCFPDFNLGWLAWIMLVPLHLALPDVAPRRAFWLGWLAGFIAFAGIMSWVVTAMHLYGKVPLVASYPLMWLLASYLGLFVALYALSVVWLRHRLPNFVWLAAPCLWVVLEFLRAHLLSGLPWMLLGYSQYQWLPIIQITDVTSVYGVSFLLILVNVALADLIPWGVQRIRRHTASSFPWPAPIAAAVAMAGAFGYGQVVLNSSTDTRTTPSVTIGVVQPNIDQAHKWDAAYRRETLDRYAKLTAQAAKDAHLVIWPEAATPFFFEDEPLYRAEVTRLVHEHGVPLLFGSPALRRYPNGRPYLLNSAYLLSPDGRILGRYDKWHLVPFGEYIPLHSSVLFFLDKLVEGIGDFEAGTVPTVFALTDRRPPLSSPLPQGGEGRVRARFSVVICYEVIFPDLVREFVAREADFMVTITNDAWFGESSAPSQHFAMVVLRAVENRVAFARSANTGISGFVDPYGRILQSTPIFTEQTLSGRIPLRTSTALYTRYGDVFAYACVIITALLFLAAYWRRGHARRASNTGQNDQ